MPSFEDLATLTYTAVMSSKGWVLLSALSLHLRIELSFLERIVEGWVRRGAFEIMGSSVRGRRGANGAPVHDGTL